MATEPKLNFCTLREAEDEIHIECRFLDGQKLAAVIVDGEFPILARWIVNALNRTFGGK
jgi:hypothetical protein